MSIHKRGNIYWLRFTTPDGHELRESTQTSDRRQAQEYHDTRKAECWRQSKLGESPRHTWQEAVVRWLEESQRKNLTSAAMHLRQADRRLGALDLPDITRDVLARYVCERKATGVKNSTVNQGLATIRTVLRAAVDWGWLVDAPRSKALPMPERRIRWLTREEADRLLAELPPYLAAMMRFSLATGLRDQNVCQMDWKQIDLERRVAWLYGDQMKAGKPLTIPLNADAMVVLRGQQGQHPQWVFPYRGHPLKTANVHTWREGLKRAGITDFRWHDLRHTWASWHVQAGTPLLVLKELGGWAKMDMVLRYAHLSVEHLADHAERISGPRLVRTISDTAPEKVAATR